MRRFLITNPRYTGEAVLLYNTDDVLQRIDISMTDMSPETIAHFKRAVPVQLSGLEAAFKAPTVVVESEVVITFEQFWKKYDHKFNKDRCEKLWDKMSKTDKIRAYYELDRYHKFLRKNPEHFKLHPDTYLRNKAWLNDYK